MKKIIPFLLLPLLLFARGGERAPMRAPERFPMQNMQHPNMQHPNMQHPYNHPYEHPYGREALRDGAYLYGSPGYVNEPVYTQPTYQYGQPVYQQNPPYGQQPQQYQQYPYGQQPQQNQNTQSPNNPQGH